MESGPTKFYPELEIMFGNQNRLNPCSKKPNNGSFGSQGDFSVFGNQQKQGLQEWRYPSICQNNEED